MGSNNSYFGAVVLIVIVAFLAAVGPAALAEGAETTAVGNEPITVDYDQETSVDEDGQTYNASVDVRNSDGDDLDRGTDYEWHPTTGTVSWIDTVATADGETAFIDYGVTQASETSLQISRVVAGLLIVGALVAIWIIGSLAISGRL